MNRTSRILSFDPINPNDVGMMEDKLLEMDRIIPRQFKNLNGIIIVRSNKTIFERYYNGYDIDNTCHIASVTKSVLSALIGIAVDKGYIKDLDQRVLGFFPEYKCSPAEVQKQAVTIRNLLTMRAPYIFKPLQEPMEKMVRRKDWITFALDMMGKNGKIGEFKYANSSANLLSAILTRTTGKSAREFANEYLFKEIGIKENPDNSNQTFDYEGLFGKDLKGWAKDPSGNSTGGWGLKLTTRDMAKFGTLYINNGIVNNKQIISEDWIQASIEGIALEKDIHVVFQRYGYLWCIYEKDGLFAYMALGDGGNMICCIPEYELVVAIASDTMRKPRDRWELVENYILPSIIK